MPRRILTQLGLAGLLVLAVAAAPSLAAPPPWAVAAGRPTTTTAPGATTTTRKPPKQTTTTLPATTTTTLPATTTTTLPATTTTGATTTTLGDPTCTCAAQEPTTAMRYRRAGAFTATGRLAGSCTGIAANPTTFTQALINANPGATFCLADGLYETGGLALSAGQQVVGTRYAVLDGTVPVTNWTGPVGGVWQSTGQTFNPDVVTPAQNPAMEAHPENGHFADLLLDRVRLTRVLATTTPGPGQWAWDYTTDTVYLGSDPTGHELRLTNQNNAFTGGGTLVGITMQWYGRIALPDAVWNLKGVAIVDNHGEAVKIGSGSYIGGGTLIARNGQYGISGGGVSSVVEDTELAFNNALRFQRSTNDKSYYDAGATKFLLSTGLIVRRVYSHDNYSDGMWADIDNRGMQVYDCRFDNNERYGFFDEISRDMDFYGNEVLDNVEGGLYVSTSGPVRAHHNTLRGPRTLFIRDDDRGNDTIDGLPRRGTGARFHDNAVTHRNTVTIEGSRMGFGGNGAVQTSLDNQWYTNTYLAPDTTSQWWQGPVGFPNYDFPGWQAAGFDTDSTLAVG